MRQRITAKFKPAAEDYLRALGYFTILVWAVLFMVFPPASAADSLEYSTRLGWLLASGAGAFVALLGALFRIDLKLELPGLLFSLIGPLMYFCTQAYYVAFPPEGDITNNRIALIAYAFLPFVLLLPRTYILLADSRRLKRINTAAGVK